MGCGGAVGLMDLHPFIEARPAAADRSCPCPLAWLLGEEVVGVEAKGKRLPMSPNTAVRRQLHPSVDHVLEGLTELLGTTRLLRNKNIRKLHWEKLKRVVVDDFLLFRDSSNMTCTAA